MGAGVAVFGVLHLHLHDASHGGRFDEEAVDVETLVFFYFDEAWCGKVALCFDGVGGWGSPHVPEWELCPWGVHVHSAVEGVDVFT